MHLSMYAVGQHNGSMQVQCDSQWRGRYSIHPGGRGDEAISGSCNGYHLEGIVPPPPPPPPLPWPGKKALLMQELVLYHVSLS